MSQTNLYLKWLGTLWMLLCSGPPLAEPAVSHAAFATLEVTQQLIAEGKPDETLIQLDKLVDNSEKRPYDQSLALQMRGHAYLARDDYGAAIRNFEKSLLLDVLPKTTAHPLRYNLAQLYLVTEQFEKAVTVLERWFRDEPAPSPEAYVLLGSAYVQVKQLSRAVSPLVTAIAKSQEPREGWYQTLLGVYYEQEDYAACTQLLQEMLHRFPQRSNYWKQLAGVHLLRDRYRDALAVMELAYTQQHIEREQDLLQIAQLYSYLAAPYKAGMLIKREMQRGRIRRISKNLETLSSAWLQAQEYGKAATALTAAAAQSADPELKLRLARLYLDREEWENAAHELHELTKSGKLKKEKAGNTWLLLGIAHYESSNPRSARAAFREALKYPSEHDDADQWLAYLDRNPVD